MRCNTMDNRAQKLRGSVPSRHIKKSFLFLWQHMRKFYGMSILYNFLSAPFFMIPPMIILQRVINILTSQEYYSEKNLAFHISLLFVLSFIYEAAHTSISSFFLLKKRQLHFKCDENYRAMIYEKVATIKGDLLENAKSYDLYRLVINRGVSSITGLWDNIISLTMNVISVSFILIASMRYNWWIPIVFLLICISTYKLQKKISQNQLTTNKIQEKTFAKIQRFNEIFLKREILAEIVIYGAMEYLNKRRTEYLTSVRSDHIKLLKKNFSSLFFIEGLVKLAIYASYFAYAYYIIIGTIKLGDFAFLTANLKLIKNSTDQIMKSVGGFHINHSFFTDYETFINMADAETGSLKLEQVESWSFENISYTYSSQSLDDEHAPYKNTPVLQSLNIAFKRGETICILGNNGSGKTTFIKILCGLLDSYDGNYQLNDKLSQAYEKPELYNMYSYASQDFIKYPFSIRDNVQFGDIDQKFSDDQLLNALDKSGFDNVVARLENGLDTFLNKEYDLGGVDISDGEWQKLLIARIIYRGRELLVFDEPTIALDPIAEKQFVDRLTEAYNNKTIVLVSHRISFALQADRVFYFENGCIAEEGTPSELLNNKGLFYEKYQKQKNFYNVAD